MNTFTSSTVNRFFALLLTLIFFQSAFSQDNFNRYFTQKSLRIDFALNGNADFQSAALQQMREEPIWGGPQKNLIDPFEYGGYYIKIYDKLSANLIYTRGFNTLFEEWRTTEQATTETQSWTNSISIPYPKQPVIFELLGRNKQTNRFELLMKQPIEPESIFIDRSPLKNLTVNKIRYNGDPCKKVDLVFLPEGYTEEEMQKFADDVQRFTEALFKTAPFDRQRSDFNIWSVNLPSEESGVDISGEGIYKNTALNSGFYTFGVSRYLTTPDMKSVRDAVWNVPCDAIFILANSERYGGGGMYNFYAIGTTNNDRTIGVFMHEFGHSFAGLADEYFYEGGDVHEEFYSLGIEPWEPNITTLINFETKWKSLLLPQTPVPTPLEAPYADKIGVFEGAGYLPKGIYRPMDHCMMRDFAPFCPACSSAILQMIDYLTDKPVVK